MDKRLHMSLCGPLLSLAVLTSGCATLTKGTSQAVTVDTDDSCIRHRRSRMWLWLAIAILLGAWLSRSPEGLAQSNAGEWHVLGLVKEDRGDLEGAISDFTRAIELNPEYADAYGDRGRAKGAKGDYSGALSDLSRAIELDPYSALAFVGRGGVRNATGDFDGAIADTSRAIVINPELAPAYVTRGDARRAKREFDAAVSDFSRAIELAPAFAGAFLKRGGGRGAARCRRNSTLDPHHRLPQHSGSRA